MPPDNMDFLGKMAIVTGWGRLEYGKVKTRETLLSQMEEVLVSSYKKEQGYRLN